uniref:Mitochondrial carrier homolog 1 n=1 Tax=Oryctolagus cuniculus TaxID=9986 RepID=G1TTA5_RABIT
MGNRSSVRVCGRGVGAWERGAVGPNHTEPSFCLLILKVGHEPMPPTLGTNVLGRKVLYLPSFFTYAKYIVQVDGKIGLFRGLSPRLMSNALSTVTRGSMKKVFPPDEMEQVSNKDDMKTSLRKVVKETSYEMMMQCVSRMLAHPLHVISMRCMVQFVGREAKYSGVLSSIGKIFKEEGLLGFFVGLIPHLLGDVVFLWGCNLLAHFINAYLVDDSFSQALAIRSYTKFVMGIAVSMLTYPFLLVGDLMAVNNCGLQAGLPPYSPVFKSWIHCWKYLSVQVSKLGGACFSAGCRQDHALPWTWPPRVRPPSETQACSCPAGVTLHICRVSVQKWGRGGTVPSGLGHLLGLGKGCGDGNWGGIPFSNSLICLVPENDLWKPGVGKQTPAGPTPTPPTPAVGPSLIPQLSWEQSLPCFVNRA